MMKNVKLFGLLILSVLVLGGCDNGENNDLTYFENRLNEFEVAVETLEADFAQIISEGDALDALRIESRDLIELIFSSYIDYHQYLAENREQHCIEDGGTYSFFADIAQYSCSFLPPFSEPDSNGIRRANILDMYQELHFRLTSIIYSFFGDDLADFERYVDELEVSVLELDSKISERLAYLEVNDRAQWELATAFPGSLHNSTDSVLRELLDESVSLENQRHGIIRGLTRYTLANSDRYPAHCLSPNTHSPGCPKWDILEVRLREF